MITTVNQTILFFRYNAPFKPQIQAWIQKLSNTSDIIGMKCCLVCLWIFIRNNCFIFFLSQKIGWLCKIFGFIWKPCLLVEILQNNYPRWEFEIEIDHESRLPWHIEKVDVCLCKCVNWIFMKLTFLIFLLWCFSCWHQHEYLLEIDLWVFTQKEEKINVAIRTAMSNWNCLLC